MFGTYRAILALMVVALHLGGISVMGSYAVFGFYILSGYLMTLIMHQNYGFTVEGVSKYYLNRVLRIYPMYWVSISVSLMLIFAMGETHSQHYHMSMYLPRDLAGILKNIFLFFPFQENPRLTPPSWALTIELFYYVCIGLGASKNKNMVVGWFILSVGYHVIVNLNNMHWRYKFFYIPAASLPFSTGALLYHYRELILRNTAKIFKKTAKILPIILCMFIFVNWSIGYSVNQLKGVFFYTNFIINTLLVVVLSGRNSLPIISKKLDKLLGDLSYPIYLFHYQVGFLVVMVANCLGFGIKPREYSLAVASMPLVFFFSWMMMLCIERPVEKIRVRIKN